MVAPFARSGHLRVTHQPAALSPVIKRTEARSGVTDSTSLVNSVEMKSDSFGGHSQGIRITCLRTEHFPRGIFMNVVYVLSPSEAPLMPCTCVIARLLLKEGKAKVVRRTPFIIKLLA